MSKFIKINLKLINYQKIKNIYTYNIKKYKIRVPGLKPGPDPDPTRGFPIPTSKQCPPMSEDSYNFLGIYYKLNIT